MAGLCLCAIKVKQLLSLYSFLQSSGTCRRKCVSINGIFII